MLTLSKLAAKAALLFISSLLVFQAQSQCNVTSTWTFNPPIPPNGAYDAGTSIQMCATISGFTSVGANWMHGFQFDLPPAFDVSTIVSNNAPMACANGGQWVFQSSYFCNGQQWGPGYYYDVNSGGPQDGNPCNNWGDPCFGATSNWQFCFTVTLDSDCGGPGNPLDGSSIIPTINVYGDGDTGSWGISTIGCNGNGNSTSPNVPVMEVNCCDSESGGSPGNVLICQNGTYDLFTELLPPVDAGGSWIGPAPWVGNGDEALFNPLTDPPGTYTYVVQGTGGCFNTTDINMVYNTNGVVQNIPYCGANPAGIRIPVPPQAAPLISPANLVFFPPGGTWYAPGYPVTQTVVPGGIVIPNVSPSGIYTYGYLNNLNCFTLSQVNMIFATGSASGCFTEYDLCAADPSPFSPFAVLGCNPQGGGQWIRYNENFGFVSFHPTFGQTFPIATGAANAIVDTTFFVYVLGTPPCPPGIDTVQVNFHPVINTGVLTQTSVCITDPPFILETLLDGTVTLGQVWTDAFNPTDTIPNLFDPSIYPPGTFFQLQYAGGLANSLCYNATILQLTILPANANAGLSNTVSVCNTDASFNMTNFLLDDPVNGPPQGGGQWVAPNGTNFGDFFTPGLSTPGVYTYNINSTCDSDQATLTVNVTVVPNPGSNGTLNICSNATNIPLFPALGNTPAGPPVTGGTWSPVAPGGLVSGNNVVNGQVYTYTVGTAPCNASATVTINLIQAPNAGVLAATPQIFCSNAAAINLMNLFTTPPSLSNPAFWSGPGGFTGGTLNPATAATGTYTYTIPNTGCGPASVSLTITIEPQPNAGLDATVNACPNGLTPINLVTPLGPGITTPGVWTNTVGGPTNGTFIPGTSPAGVYTYTVSSASGTCTDFANITVNYLTLPNPGTTQILNICSNAGPIPLNSINLGQSPLPDTNGFWINPSGIFITNPAIFTPGTSVPGNYTYAVPVAGGCPAVTAVHTINVTPLPNAGTNATTTRCASFGSVDLTSYLGGTPASIGTWTDLSNNSSVTNPLDISGLGGTTLSLQYSITTGPCTASSTLTLTVQNIPNAGTGNSLAFCSNSPSFNLNTGLTGSPNGGGTWVNTTSGTALTPAQALAVNPATLGTGATFVYTVTPSSCPSVSATVPVTITPALTISGLTTTCQPNQNFYTVTFTVTGGQAPINIANGTLTGGVFTSNPIAAGTAYGFIVQDASTCADLNVNGASPICTCPASASFGGGNQTICLGGTANIPILLAGAPPYNVTYNDGTGPNTLTGINAGFIWNVSPTGTTTYTLVSVADANCTSAASSTVTITVEQPLNAGPDVPLSYCATGAPLNLNTVLNSAASAGGTWTPSSNPTLTAANSGVYTYTVNGTQCPNDAALYTLTINPPITVSLVQAACQPNQTNYVVTFTIAGGQSPYSVNGITLAGNTFTSALQPVGSPFPYAVEDSGPCAAVNGNVNSPNCTCPATAAFGGGNQTICAGGTAIIPIILTGIPTYNVTYAVGGVNAPQLLGINNGFLLSVSPAITTTYTLVSMNDANCAGSAIGSVTITVEQQLNAGPDVPLNYCATGAPLNLNTVLNSAASAGGTWTPSSNPTLTAANSGVYTYTVNGTQCPNDAALYTLNINPPITVSLVQAACQPNQTDYVVTFTIAGGQGPYSVNGNTLVGNTFTSALQPVGSPFPYAVEDSGPCAPVNGNVNSPNCNCPATAAFGGGNQTICAGGTANIPIILTGTPAYNVTYAVGGANAPQLLGINNGFLLSVSPAITTTYTLISMNDANCAGSANGSVTITVEQPLNAGPDVLLNYCATGAPLNLNTVLNSAASAGGTLTPSSNPTLTAANSGVYTYTVNGTQCPNDVALYTLNINPPITVSLVQAACQPNQTDYVVTFTIAGGQGPYSVNGNTLVGNTFTSALQPVGSPFPYAVEDSGPCAAVNGNVNSPNCNCPATAAFGGGNQTICAGGTANIPIILTGTPAYNVTYAVGGANAPQLLGINNGFLLSVSPTITTTYTLISMNDANCAGSANGSITITVDNQLNAGPDVISGLNYCAGGPSVNLNTLLNASAYTPGTWTSPLGAVINPPTVVMTAANSGNYTYAVGGNACPNDASTYTLNIAPVLAFTGVLAACTPMQTAYTVSFNITGGTPPYFVNGLASGAAFTSAPLDFATNPNYNFIISDSGVCSDVVVANTAPACDCLATGSISGSATICAGTCTNMTFALSGNGPFSVIYLNSNDPFNPTQLNGISNGHIISVCPSSTATYTLLSVTDANCTGDVIGNSVTVAINPIILATGATTICNATNEGYQVQVNISGGVGPYSVNPAGTLNTVTGVYLSPVYQNGTGYSISIDDAGACPAVLVQGGAYTCPCVSSAGTLPTAPQEICLGGQLSFSANGNAVLDGNDGLQYVLHSGSATSLGSVIATSNTGSFTFNYLGITAGNTYYVNVVVGNTDAFGNVNLNHPCTAVSTGAAVSINAIPSASISGSDAVCVGEAVDFNINFTGDGPWDFQYAVNGAPSGPNFSPTPNYVLTTTQVGNYTLIEVSDSHCTGTVSGNASLQNFATPTALLSGNPEICENSGSGPQVNITGASPYTLIYAIDGVAQAPLSLATNIYTIPAATSGVYSLVSLDDSNCSGSVSGILDVTILSAPTASLLGGGAVCEGDAATFTLQLTGEGPWNVQYTVDGVPQGSINTNNSNYTFESGEGGNYGLVSIQDANCQGDVLFSQASLNINPIPSAEISTQNSIFCIGQEVALSLDLEGVPPFVVTYVLDGDTITASGIFGDIFQTLTPTSSFSAEVLFVSDGSNPTCSLEPMAFEYLSAVELPNAPVLTDVQSCASEGAQQIGIAGAANLSYFWSPADHLSDPNIPNPTFSADIPGIVPQTFQYVLSATNGDCTASDTMTIVLHPSPRVRFEYSPQPIVSEDPSVRFENKSSSLNPLGYVWEFGTLGSSTEEDPIFVFPDGIAAEYSVTLIATDQITGCVNQWTDILSVRPQLLIFVPNAFTPDGDGLNDLWGPVTRNVDGDDYRLTVFSRLGDIVFETRNPKQKWNGSLRGNDYFVEAGVYVWKIETKNELTLEEVKYQGNVTVVR